MPSPREGDGTDGSSKNRNAGLKSAKLEEIIKLREEELRNDTNARFVDPHNVWCVICDRNIKLSDRSRFDLSHWREHKRKKHGIRGHTTTTTRSLVEDVKERKQRQRQRKSFAIGDTITTTTTTISSSSSSSRAADRKSLTIRLYPSPPSSQSSSSSSSGDTPNQKPTGRRFNPIGTTSSNSGSNSLRRSKRNQSSKQTPLYTTTRLHSREDSPLTSSSSSSSLTSLASSDCEAIVPLPSLPDLRISSEIEAYVHFERLDVNHHRDANVPNPEDDDDDDDSGPPGAGPGPWTKWTFSRLTVPGWCLVDVDEVEDFELKLAPTDRGRRDDIDVDEPGEEVVL